MEWLWLPVLQSVVGATVFSGLVLFVSNVSNRKHHEQFMGRLEPMTKDFTFLRDEWGTFRGEVADKYNSIHKHYVQINENQKALIEAIKEIRQDIIDMKHYTAETFQQQSFHMAGLESEITRHQMQLSDILRDSGKDVSQNMLDFRNRRDEIHRQNKQQQEEIDRKWSQDDS